MYTLFWEKGSGSMVVQALLEEMDVEYSLRYVDMESGEHKNDEYPERYTRDEGAIEPVRLAAEDDITSFFDVLDQAIKGRPYFLYSGFCVIDLYLAMLTEFHPNKEGPLRRNSKVSLLYEAVNSRPAFSKAILNHS